MWETSWGFLSSSLLCVTCRNGSSNDPCDKPRHGHVLGDIPLEPDGNNGETQSKIHSFYLHKFQLFPASHYLLFLFLFSIVPNTKCLHTLLYYVTLCMFFSRKRTLLRDSSTRFPPSASRQSTTCSRERKWRCSYLSCSIR